MDPYRIVLADDHFLIRQGLRRVLEGRDNLAVVGEASDGLELLFLVERLKPHLAILDISMPNLQGIETARQIKMKYPEIKILILTIHNALEYVWAAVSAGVDGYLLKDDIEKDLLLAIEKIRQGKGFISPILAESLKENNKWARDVLKFLLED